MAPGFFSKLARSRRSSESSTPTSDRGRDRAVTLPGSQTSTSTSTSSGFSGRQSSSASTDSHEQPGLPKVEVTPVAGKTTNAIKDDNGRWRSSTSDNGSSHSSISSPEVTVVPPSPQASTRSSLVREEKAGAENGGKKRPERLSCLEDEDVQTPLASKQAFTVESPTQWQQSPEGFPPAASPASTTGTSPATSPSSAHSLASPTTTAAPLSTASHQPAMSSASKQDANGNGNGMPASPASPAESDDYMPTPGPVHGRAATYAGPVDPSLLAPSGHGKRDPDSVSITSSASRKRGLFKKSSYNNVASNPLPSPKRKPTGLATAIASSGLAMVNPAMAVPPMPDPWRPRSSGKESQPPSPSNSRIVNSRSNRSPALFGGMDSEGQLTTSPRSRANSLSIPSAGARDGGAEDFDSAGSDDGDLDDDDAQLLADLGADDIPVTGFAVASNKRNADFHDLFPAVPEGDYLIEDYGCALQREILIQGRLYISEHHICFHANIFGWVTDVIIPIYEILALDKKMTAFVIPNALQITTRTAKYNFASFLARDTVYDVIDNIRKLERSDVGSEQDVILSGPMTPAAAAVVSAGATAAPAHKVTHCACGREGKHFSEIALESVLPGTPESIYNLMFASGFIKDFMREELKLEDIQISDWTPSSDGPKCLSRNMSYIKPLNGSIGPRQTKCEIRDETIYSDFDDYVVTITTTRTPDVPSGNVFAVKTRTCIMWASTVSTRIIVSTQVEWTGRSFIRGIIERSCIEGQKTQYADLERAMRAYIAAHQTEFVPAGVDPALVEAQTPPTPSADAPAKADAPVSPAALAEARERERNARGMQWAYDTFAGASDVARRSTMGALELVREAWDTSSGTTILWFVIVFLVASNLWTLARMGSREEAGRRKEMRKIAERERWVQGVVGALWDEIGAVREQGAHAPPHLYAPTPRPTRADGSIDVQAEVAALGAALDAVEERVKVLRATLDSLD